jgi:hypothetical protein
MMIKRLLAWSKWNEAILPRQPLDKNHVSGSWHAREVKLGKRIRPLRCRVVSGWNLGVKSLLTVFGVWIDADDEALA